MEWAIESLILAIEIEPDNEEIKSELQALTDVYQLD